MVFSFCIHSYCRSQWPRGLRRRSTAARLLRSWVRIPPGAWMFVCCECCVLSARDLCNELITRPAESTDCGVSFCVIQKPQKILVNEEEAKAHQGAIAPREKRERERERERQREREIIHILVSWPVDDPSSESILVAI